MRWGAGCLALRTRNGRFKNSFISGGTLLTHPACSPEFVDMWHEGLPNKPDSTYYGQFCIMQRIMQLRSNHHVFLYYKIEGLQDPEENYSVTGGNWIKQSLTLMH